MKDQEAKRPRKCGKNQIPNSHKMICSSSYTAYICDSGPALDFAIPYLPLEEWIATLNAGPHYQCNYYNHGMNYCVAI